MSNEVATPEKTHSFVDHLQSVLRREKERDEAYEIEPRLNLIEYPVRLWRLDKGSVRYYFNPEREEFYGSTTSVLGTQMKDSYYLREWQLKKAVESGSASAPNDYMNERSAYGTLMHILFTEALIFGQLDSKMIEQAVVMYRNIFEYWHYDVRSWIPELKNDVGAFAQWYHDFEIKPLAVEMPIIYPVIDPESNKMVLMIAGTIDLVCEMWMRTDGGDITPRTPMNRRKRGIAVVDYKSGKKGFYDSHVIQVNSYLDGYNWNCNPKGGAFLPDNLTAERCYNFAPKDSRGDKYTYDFKNQTGSEVYKKFPHFVKLFKQDGLHEVRDIRSIEGTFIIGKNPKDTVSVQSAVDYMKQKYEVSDA